MNAETSSCAVGYSKGYPTHSSICKIHADALLCLRNAATFCSLINGLLIRQSIRIAVNCMQMISRTATAHLEKLGGLHQQCNQNTL